MDASRDGAAMRCSLVKNPLYLICGSGGRQVAQHDLGHTLHQQGRRRAGHAAFGLSQDTGDLQVREADSGHPLLFACPLVPQARGFAAKKAMLAKLEAQLRDKSASMPERIGQAIAASTASQDAQGGAAVS